MYIATLNTSPDEGKYNENSTNSYEWMLTWCSSGVSGVRGRGSGGLSDINSLSVCWSSLSTGLSITLNVIHPHSVHPRLQTLHCLLNHEGEPLPISLSHDGVYSDLCVRGVEDVNGAAESRRANSKPAAGSDGGGSEIDDHHLHIVSACSNRMITECLRGNRACSNICCGLAVKAAKWCLSHPICWTITHCSREHVITILCH